jgi:hypothetical protein
VLHHEGHALDADRNDITTRGWLNGQ